MAVLCEEILMSAHGTEGKAIQPTWFLPVASVSSVSVKAMENEGGDDPNSPYVSLSSWTRLMLPHAMHISYKSVHGWFTSTT